MTSRDALLASVIRHVDMLSRSMVLGVIIDHFAVRVGVVGRERLREIAETPEEASMMAGGWREMGPMDRP